MKKKQSQSGFVHLAIIIVLVVALIGAIGYIAWDKFMQPKDGDENVVATKTTNDSTDTTTTPVADNEGYLVLDDWGVKFKLPADLGDDEIVYEEASDTSGSIEVYYFSTKYFSLLGSTCSRAYSLIRSTDVSTDSIGAPIIIGKIGNYYYSYYTPQSFCLDNNEKGIDVEQKVSKMLPLMFESIESK